jgi:hypothetical protein
MYRVMAKPCLDARGKFVKCPPAAAAPKTARTPRLQGPKTGKFAKCSAPTVERRHCGSLTGAGFLRWEKIVLLSSFILPLVARPLARFYDIPIGPLVLLALFAVVVRRAARLGSDSRRPRDVARREPPARLAHAPAAMPGLLALGGI